jgi:hypothetical protein
MRAPYGGICSAFYSAQRDMWVGECMAGRPWSGKGHRKIKALGRTKEEALIGVRMLWECIEKREEKVYGW